MRIMKQMGTLHYHHSTWESHVVKIPTSLDTFVMNSITVSGNENK